MKNFFNFKNLSKIIVIALIFSFSGLSALAFDPTFKINIYNTSDTELRSQIDVVSVRNTNYINFYIDEYVWKKMSSSDQSKISNFANLLSSEFEYNIYPKIIKVFPNIADWLNFQKKLIIVFTPMTSGIQGYVRWDDFNSLSQSKTSNDGNIVYLNSNNLLNSNIANNVLYSFFTHEFMHLISYREKNAKYNIEEEVWLEELRSEYIAHYLGYNQTKDSYLNFRLQNGISLTDVNLKNWNNTSNSYSLINLFSIYLADRFTPDIIFQTLLTNLSGTQAIDSFLKQRGYTEKFSNIYQDWIIANILNDCTVNKNYCYKNLDIQINIPGSSFFLPINNDSTLSISDSLISYQTKYQKIVGGSDNLEVTLENTKNNIFQKVPYILIDKTGQKTLNFFEFNNATTKQLTISDYSKKYSNIIIIPMFANSNEDITQLFKWHINSYRSLTTTTVKPIVRTTTTTSDDPNSNIDNTSTTSTTLKNSSFNQPDFGNASPIIINIVNPVKTIPWYLQFINGFKAFFQNIFSRFL